MNKIIDQAHIVHRTATRLRLRVPARKLDHAYFRDLKVRLAGCPGVRSVEPNPLTGSVLIAHDPEFYLAALGAAGLALGIQEHGGGRQPGDCLAILHRAMAKRDESSDPLMAVAKLIFAAATGRLWSHLLDLFIEWCADALIKSLLQPMRAASAQVIQLPQPRRSHRQAIAAAA
jgi:hypothetical protein